MDWDWGGGWYGRGRSQVDGGSIQGVEGWRGWDGRRQGGRGRERRWDKGHMHASHVSGHARHQQPRQVTAQH